MSGLLGNSIRMKHTGINHPQDEEGYSAPKEMITRAGPSIKGDKYRESKGQMFTEKPTRDTLVRLMNSRQKLDTVLREEHNKSVYTPEQIVDRDIALAELQYDLNETTSLYYLALQLYNMSDSDFAEWQMQNGLLPPSEWNRVSDEREHANAVGFQSTRE